VEPSAQIVIPAKLEQLRTLEHWVQRIALQFLLPQPLIHRIDLCLAELVTNVISYGYPDGRVGSIRIQFWRQPENITLRIEDDAAVFDPSSYQPPDLPRVLADAPAGGRGIRLARHFADELHYVALPVGNQLTLVFHAVHGNTARPAGRDA
jgi:anti-sigma regulatory factor (Ser/Thr protein kinase)